MNVLSRLATPAALLAATLAAAQTASIFAVQPTPNVSVQGNVLSAVTSIAPDDVWAVGFRGNATNYNQARTLAEHYDGKAWTFVPTPNPNPGNCPDPSLALTGVATVASNDVWAVGFRNQNFTCTSLFQPIAMHWNGTAWTYAFTPPLSRAGNNALNAALALGPADVWAVGYQSGPLQAVQTLVEHYNGSSWSVFPSPNANSTGNVLNAIAAVSPTDIWAVGDQVAPNLPVLTLTEHYDGTAWTVIPSPNPVTSGTLDQNVLTGVIVLAPNDVTAVGYILDFTRQRKLTLIEHWDGSKWSIVPSPNPSTASGSLNILNAIAAISPTNIYAFGYFSNGSTGGQTLTLAVHYDGRSWTVVPSPTPARAQQLFGAASLPSANQLWSVGGFSIPGINFEFGFLQLPKTLALHTASP